MVFLSRRSNAAASLHTDVSGVVVTYNPDLDVLERLVEAVFPQLSHLVIVDNGSGDGLTSWLAAYKADIEYVPLGENLGIAKAQNVGIDRARARGSNYVLLLDQDSLPAPDMVAILRAAAERKTAEGVAVACVGPRYEDARQKDAAPFVRAKGLRLERLHCTAPADIVEVDFLIASGCLIPIQTLNAVGMMREELFIDYVDIEWGLRANQKGFRAFGICAARMEHALGDSSVLFRGRHIPVHSPLRHYYHFRNAVWLCRQSWLTREWKLILVFRMMRQFLFFSVVTPPRLGHARMMALGAIDGFRKRLGEKVANH